MTDKLTDLERELLEALKACRKSIRRASLGTFQMADRAIAKAEAKSTGEV
jgi:hypothetical protein